MSILTLLDIFITGLLQGGIFSLIAMGLSLQYGVARVFNVSYGEFIMLAAFMTWVMFSKFEINPFFSVLLWSGGGLIVGYIVYKIIFHRLYRKAASPSAFESGCLLASFGLVYIIENFALAIWGGEIKGYTYFNSTIEIWGIAIVANRLISLIIAMGTSLGFYLFLAFTRIGKAIRASAQNPEAARMCGVNVESMLTLCFSLGTLMAGLGGVITSLCYPISVAMGLEYTLIAIIVTVIGGLGSITGSLIGGLLLGFIGSLVSYWDVSLSLVAYYLLFMLLLLIRPTGIFKQ